MERSQGLLPDLKRSGEVNADWRGVTGPPTKRTTSPPTVLHLLQAAEKHSNALQCPVAPEVLRNREKGCYRLGPNGRPRVTKLRAPSLARKSSPCASVLFLWSRVVVSTTPGSYTP